MLGYSRFLAKSLHSKGLIALHSHNQMGGAVSYDLSKYRRHGVLTAVTHRQPGVPGLHIPSTGFDGATSYNNIYSAGFANNSTLLNGGFETPGAGGVDIWANFTEVAGDGALANEVVVVHQGVDACKMTSGATSNTKVESDAMVSVPGAVRRFRFFARGDGANAGRYGVYDVTNGANIIAPTTTGITAAAWGMVAPQYTVPAGCVSVRIDYWCPPVNGGICYFDAGEVRGMDGFLGDVGTIVVPAQVANVGVWTDGAARHLFDIKADANNEVWIRRSAVNNAIQFRYVAGSVAVSQNTAALANLDFATYGMTWDISAGATGEVRYYIRGIPSGATAVGLGTWTGDLLATNAVIGAGATTPANVWSGNIAPVPIFNEAKSPTEMKYLMSP